MGTLGNGDGGGWPPEGRDPFDGLPELPPDWGPIVVPDDPAELAAEAALVRRELRRARRGAWRRLGPPARPDARGTTQASLGLPILIMSIAVLAALTSLFAFAWPVEQRQATTAPTTNPPPPRGALPALDLIDRAGTTVPLRGLLPAVIILTDKCACASLVTATAATAPPAVTVVALANTRPAPAPAVTTKGPSIRVRDLIDPASALRDFVGVAPSGKTATVLLVTASGEVLRILPAATSIEEFRTDLNLLERR